MNDPHITPETPPQPDPLAIALSKLDPAPHGIDRDAFMFAAGRESKARTIAHWQIAAAAAMVSAAFFALLFFLRAP